MHLAVADLERNPEDELPEFELRGMWLRAAPLCPPVLQEIAIYSCRGSWESQRAEVRQVVHMAWAFWQHNSLGKFWKRQPGTGCQTSRQPG